MACISSPVASRWASPAAHPRPRDVGGIRPNRLPFIPAQRFGVNAQQQPTMSTPAPHPRKPRPVTNQKAVSFDALKSPVSRSIDNILGAAEAVNRRDAWLAKRYPKKRKPAPPAEQPPAVALVEQQPPLGSSFNLTPTGLVHQQRLGSSFKLTPSMRNTDNLELLLEDKGLYRSLVLTMALERPRKDTLADDVPDMVIGEGFYWKEYPKLENVLYEQMAEYYSFSANSRQSKCQQAYNNTLVDKMKIEATKHGYTFNPHVYSDKKLRDRIRCFYKTHLQNAKKRLHTLQKHLDAPEQRRLLRELIDKAQELVPELAATFSPIEQEREYEASEARKRQRQEY